MPASMENCLAVAGPGRKTDAEIACDIFCAVIDNFGDIGVCWRLARQLKSRSTAGRCAFSSMTSRLSTRSVPPSIRRSIRQEAGGVVIEHWHTPTHAGDTLQIADVVIEAFGCELPAASTWPPWRAAIAKPVWFNLEYLSAEDWVADFHLRPSPHPRHALNKTFFFPGLGARHGRRTEGTDARYAEREAFQRDAWWQERVGITAPSSATTVISLFAYENPAIDTLLSNNGAIHPRPLHCWCRKDGFQGAVARFFGLPGFAAGSKAESGSLKAYALGFVEQPLLRRLALGRRYQFRARRRFVRARAMGAKTVRVADLPASRRCPSAQARRRARPLRKRLAGARARCAGAVLACLERRRRAGLVRTFWQHRRHLEQRAADWALELASYWRSGWKSGGFR